MYSGNRRYRKVHYVTQYVPIETQSGGSDSTVNVQSDKQVTITSNGTTTIQPDSSYDALSQVTVTTNVAGSSSPITIKKIVLNSTTSVPDSEIIPLSSFSRRTYNSPITIQAGEALVKISNPEGNNPGGLLYVVANSTLEISTSLGDYFYNPDSTSTYLSLLDEDNNIVTQVVDRGNDTLPTYIRLMPNFFQFDFSSQ